MSAKISRRHVGVVAMGALATVAWAAGCAWRRPAPPATSPPVSDSPPEAPVARSPTGEVTLAFVGDVLLWGPVEAALRKQGVSFAFAEVKEALSRVDLACGNLECPLTTVEAPTPLKYAGPRLLSNEFVFKARPDVAGALSAGSLDVVSLANNHLMDHGAKGLRDTLGALDRMGLRHCGGGMTLAEARKPAVSEVRGTRLAFLSYCWTRTLPGTAHFAAGDNSGGIVFVDTTASGQPTTETLAEMKRALSAARELADLVFVLFHWGDECVRRPNAAQRALAKAAVEFGADMVVGHHPHCLQSLETLNGKPVLYSLGNFVFRSQSLLTRESAIAEVTVSDGKLTGVTLQPVLIDEIRPRPATTAEALRVCRRLAGLSADLMTPVTIDTTSGCPRAAVDLSPAAQANFVYEAGLRKKHAGQLPAAIDCFRRAGERGRSKADVHYATAWCYAALGKRDFARSHFEAFLEVEPHGKRAKEARAALERMAREAKPPAV